MSQVKWIKLETGMFDDEKIKIIESMPDCDTLLVLWVKMLTLAGRVNSGGYIFLSDTIPYTDELLATVFHRPLNTVRLALQTFQRFGMITQDEKGIFLPNFEKHQNTAGLDKIREDTRKRVAAYRERQQLKLIDAPKTVTSYVTLPSNDVVLGEKNPENEPPPQIQTKAVTRYVTVRNALEEEKKKNRKEKNISSSSTGKIFSEYEKNIGLLTPIISERLMMCAEETCTDWVVEAITESVKYNKRSLAYIEAILKRWSRDGKNSTPSPSLSPVEFISTSDVLDSDIDRQDEAERCWKEVLAYLNERVTKSVMDTWFKPTKAAGFSGKAFVLLVPSRDISDGIRRHESRILDALAGQASEIRYRVYKE